MTLSEILDKNGWNTATDKESRHKYCTSVYDELFSTLQEKRLRILEIGISNGASLALFHEYFKDADIYGVDIINWGSSDNCAPFPRIKITYTNAYSEEYVKILPKFDIIVEDGPHTKESQLFVLKHYVPLLTKGGILIIEDISELSWTEDFIKALDKDVKYKVVDNRHISSKEDSILFIVTK